MTLNDYFTLNSVFAPVCLVLEIATLENNCVNTSTDRLILLVEEMFSRKSSFWQYKVCAYICAGSLESGSQIKISRSELAF